MSNYIRAGFCVAHSLRAGQLYALLVDLEQLDWRYNVWRNGKVSGSDLSTGTVIAVKEEVLHPDFDSMKVQQLAERLSLPGYLNIEFAYRSKGDIYSARIIHALEQEHKHRYLSFDIEERVFLPGKVIEYTPNGDGTFEAYKQVITRVISRIDPTFGGIDYELDLPCNKLAPRHYRRLVNWGTYLPESVISRWPESAVASLDEIVDEQIQIDNMGILTFIHPLASNQAWTRRHERVYSLFMDNPVENWLPNEDRT